MYEEFEEIRRTTDCIIREVDEQALRNFEMNLRVNHMKSELVHNLQKLDEHTYCPGKVSIGCTSGEKCVSKCKGHHEEIVKAEVKKEEVAVVHGDDCHCSKCCPNPNPNFFQKHRQGLLLGFLWVAMIVLAVGWSPSGPVFDEVQASFVDLLVNFFKMGIFAIAGIVTYSLAKKK